MSVETNIMTCKRK